MDGVRRQNYMICIASLTLADKGLNVAPICTNDEVVKSLIK